MGEGTHKGGMCACMWVALEDKKKGKGDEMGSFRIEMDRTILSDRCMRDFTHTHTRTLTHTPKGTKSR